MHQTAAKWTLERCPACRWRVMAATPPCPGVPTLSWRRLEAFRLQRLVLNLHTTWSNQTKSAWYSTQRDRKSWIALTSDYITFRLIQWHIQDFYPEKVLFKFTPKYTLKSVHFQPFHILILIQNTDFIHFIHSSTVVPRFYFYIKWWTIEEIWKK